MNPQSLILIVLIAGAGWMLLIRPQKRRQQAQRELLDRIQPGVEVLTAAGLYGKVVDAEGDDVHVEIADGVVVRVARRAIGAVIPPEEEPAEPEAETAAEEGTEGDAGPEPPS